jgi:hypothetical protein
MWYAGGNCPLFECEAVGRIRYSVLGSPGFKLETIHEEVIKPLLDLIRKAGILVGSRLCLGERKQAPTLEHLAEPPHFRKKRNQLISALALGFIFTYAPCDYVWSLNSF